MDTVNLVEERFDAIIAGHQMIYLQLCRQNLHEVGLAN